MARVKIRSSQYQGARSKSTTCICTDSDMILLTSFKPVVTPQIRLHPVAPRQSMAKVMSFALVTSNRKIVFLMVQPYLILTIAKCAFLSTSLLVMTLRMRRNKTMKHVRTQQYSGTGRTTTRSKNHQLLLFILFL